MGYRKVEKIFNSSNIELKISNYSDLRVAPFGVTSMEERLAEGKKRYASRIAAKYSVEEFEGLVKKWRGVEKQIFERCSIAPSNITDEGVASIIEELREFEVETD
jgi:hypothetical protein